MRIFCILKPLIMLTRSDEFKNNLNSQVTYILCVVVSIAKDKIGHLIFRRQDRVSSGQILIYNKKKVVNN